RRLGRVGPGAAGAGARLARVAARPRPLAARLRRRADAPAPRRARDVLRRARVDPDDARAVARGAAPGSALWLIVRPRRRRTIEIDRVHRVDENEHLLVGHVAPAAVGAGGLLRGRRTLA